MEKIEELLDSYALGQYLLDKNYIFGKQDFNAIIIFEVRRDIENIGLFNNLAKVTKFRGSGSVMLDLSLYTKKERKVVKDVNEYYNQFFRNGWNNSKVLSETIFKMKFDNEDSFINFFNDYIVEGDLQ